MVVVVVVLVVVVVFVLVVVFVVGGVTLAEVREIHELSEHFQVDIILGGSTILTPKRLIEALLAP